MKTLIKNGLVYDGTGNTPVKADILISGNSIEKIGNFPYKSAALVIDASDRIVTPGFVDIAVRGDDYKNFFFEEDQNKFLMRGITTLIGGTRGESIAPFSSRTSEQKMHIRCKTEGNRNWQFFKDFFASARHIPRRLNYGTLVGFHTIKNFSVHSSSNSDITTKDHQALLEMVNRAFHEGVLGISFDFRNPQSFLSSKKLFYEIAECTATYGGIISVTLGNGKGISQEIGDMRTVSRSTGAHIHITDFGYAGNAEEAEKIISGISRAERRINHVRISFDFSPFSFEEMPGIEFLPLWARQKNCDEIRKILKSRIHRARILQESKNNIPKKAILSGFSKNLSVLNGLTLAEFSKNRGKTIGEGFLNALLLSDFSLHLLVPHNPETIRELFISPISIVSSHASPDYRGQKDPRQLFGLISEPHIPLESLIHKYTLLPAQKFNLEKRGIIKEGYRADILVFSQNREIEEVFVNGIPAIREGKTTETKSGEIIMRKQK